VSRSKGKNVGIMSLEEYNSIQETLHLVSSKTNQKRLDEAIEEMRSGKSSKHKLIKINGIGMADACLGGLFVLAADR